MASRVTSYSIYLNKFINDIKTQFLLKDGRFFSLDQDTSNLGNELI